MTHIFFSSREVDLEVLEVGKVKEEEFFFLRNSKLNGGLVQAIASAIKKLARAWKLKLINNLHKIMFWVELIKNRSHSAQTLSLITT